jgi:predicted RND superfamily exporter protein
MGWFEDVFGRWVVKKRWWIIAATIIIVAVAASGVRFMSFTNDNRIFFSGENPQLKALEELENTYNRIDNVVFVIAPEDGNVFTRRTLSAMEELTEASWQMPYSNRVDSITNFQHTRAEGDELIVEDLVLNAESLSDADIKRIRQTALSEPLIVNRLLSDSGHVASVNVNVLTPGKSLDEAPEIAAFARRTADDLKKKYPGIDLYLTGGVMFDNAFGEASQNDMATLIPAMFIMILVIIGLTLRSFTGTFTTLIIVLISMFTGLGLTGWLGIPLNAASVNAPTIILILAVADSVHILATIFQQMRLGKSKREAVAEALRINLQPVFLTSATTAIGFLTMNFSDAPPFRELGNIVAMGVMSAFVYSVTFLPAMISVLPVRTRQKHDRAGCSNCSRIADFVVNRRKQIFIGTFLLTAVLISGISQIELNDEWLRYFDESYDIRKASDFATENLTGFDVIEYSLNSGEAGGINNPEYLKKLEEFAAWYRKQPDVVHINTITDTIKRLNKNMHGDDENYYRVPEDRELAAQYLLLYEMSLPFGLDLNNQINVDKSATRFIVSFKSMSAKVTREMDKKAMAWLKANPPEEMLTYGSGLTVIWAHISQRNIDSMLGASFLALMLISGLLIFALRSLKLGVLSLVPNLTPALMAFGVWGMAVGQIGLGLSVVVAMTLGIVVDDTVHFMSKYIRARRENNTDSAGAVRYAFNTVGNAMMITTASLVGGFLVLTYSGYSMNSDMGLLSAITITIALLMDFFFLPVLLMKIDSKSYELIYQEEHDEVLSAAE